MTHNKWCLIYGSLVFSRSSTPRFHHESYIISIRWGLDAEEIKAFHARLVGRERELDGSWRESSSDDWLYIDMIICHICVGLIRSGECGITQVVVSWRLAPSIEIIQVLQRTNAKKIWSIKCTTFFATCCFCTLEKLPAHCLNPSCHRSRAFMSLHEST